MKVEAGVESALMVGAEEGMWKSVDEKVREHGYALPPVFTNWP